MRTLTRSALATACLLLLAAPAMAQVPGIDLKVNPRIGLYAPMSNLGSGSAAESIALNNSLALGLGIELGLVALPFNVRANLDYATGATVTEEGIGETDQTATVLAVVADLVFRPLPRILVLEPYLFAGGGLKQYAFDAAAASDFRDASDPTIHLGAGLDFGLGPIALNAELGNYISWYQLTAGDSANMQHDIFFTVGFSIGML